jgi:hypothetical protein
MRKEVARTIVPQIRHLENGFSAELVIRASLEGKRIAAVPVTHFSRRYGVGDQFTLRKLPQVAINQLIGLVRLKSELSTKQKCSASLT